MRWLVVFFLLIYTCIFVTATTMIIWNNGPKEMVISKNNWGAGCFPGKGDMCK